MSHPGDAYWAAKKGVVAKIQSGWRVTGIFCRALSRGKKEHPSGINRAIRRILTYFDIFCQKKWTSRSIQFAMSYPNLV